jgi:hypothetical protein
VRNTICAASTRRDASANRKIPALCGLRGLTKTPNRSFTASVQICHYEVMSDVALQRDISWFADKALALP